MLKTYRIPPWSPVQCAYSYLPIMRTKIVNYKRDCCYQRTLSIIPPKKKESQTLVASSVQERERKKPWNFKITFFVLDVCLIFILLNHFIFVHLKNTCIPGITITIPSWLIKFSKKKKQIKEHLLEKFNQNTLKKLNKRIDLISCQNTFMCLIWIRPKN